MDARTVFVIDRIVDLIISERNVRNDEVEEVVGKLSRLVTGNPYVCLWVELFGYPARDGIEFNPGKLGRHKVAIRH